MTQLDDDFTYSAGSLSGYVCSCERQGASALLLSKSGVSILLAVCFSWWFANWKLTPRICNPKI